MFATTSPPYAEKSNAATVHAALVAARRRSRSLELGATSRAGLSRAARSGSISPPRAGARSWSPSDVVIGAPGGARESSGGDAAVELRVRAPTPRRSRVLRGRASATTEVLDVWRLPEDASRSQWEERFGAEVLAPVLADVVTRALEDARRAAVASSPP